ncbi:hypothetical protein COU17_00385 [Candidatus Kaiserbacteria bacterium CG10_big_fil_rev_8_21_14_0_10_49_17]|uniref:DUF2269 domain-containing protein n=1 Tax=Candidatus Kaiserbacteria bacterium CG10_big_fil_rev_8_21_14_0_10_49_17 TaxID=1974609 RepID=A0A2M6WFA1_9BACT|nr:MAG: hypothetical protein COU17_00385 [Candidatus Kaiserbacteria bacterium CG10_big_fil_rev_8_21_14_0_10_49_17]
MPDLHILLVWVHIIGAVLGTGGATLAEIFSFTALKDGVVSADEKRMMHANYFMIRIGTLLVLLSGFALVAWWVFVEGNIWPLTSGKVWVKDIMVLAIVINAVLLTRRLIPFWLGSAISFTSWWGATILGAWRHAPISFTEALLGYIVAIFIVAGVLELLRLRFRKKYPR